MRTVGILTAILFLALAGVAEELRCVSYNMWTGLDYDGMLKMGEYESAEIREQRYQVMLQELRGLDPDIISLNEVNYLPRTARRLARDLGMDQIQAMALSGIKIMGLGIPVNLREGGLILAKPELELKRVGKFKLSGSNFGIYTRLLSFQLGEARFLLLGEISWQGESLYVGNTHLHASILHDESIAALLDNAVAAAEITSGERQLIQNELQAGLERRIDETGKLLHALDEELTGDSKVILMGDFNDIPGSQIYQMITEKSGFLDSYERVNPDSAGYTWHPGINSNIDPIQTSPLEAKTDLQSRMDLLDYRTPARIDFIFLRNITPAKVTESQVVFDRKISGYFPSDHLGVMTILDF